MSVAYGGPPGGAAYQPPGRVNFGWIGEAFELFKANPGVWIVATLMAFVPSVIGGIVGGVEGFNSARAHPYGQPPFSPSPFGSGQNPITGGLPPALYSAIQIFSAVYGAWLYAGIYYTAVKQVRGEMISLSDIFSGGPRMLRMLGFNIVYGLAVGIGIVLCILPGVLLSGLLFLGYALIAEGETVGNAISRSIDAMKRDMWNAAAFVFVMGLLLVVSIIPCGLGLFVTLPMFFLTTALAYRDMIGLPGQSAPTYGAPGTPAGTWPPAPGTWPPPPQTYSPPPPQTYSPPPPLSPLPTEPTPEPRRSLSGEPIDDPPAT